MKLMIQNYKSEKKITVPEQYRFFGEDAERNIDAFLSEFEPNTFNVKGMTGCGATTMLLENYQPMIIAVPTNELSDCKSNAKRHRGQVFWYKKGKTDDDIRVYLSSVVVPKFIVVYDRTEYLFKALTRIEEENIRNKYVLAVDEAHMLMTALSYRDSAIKSLTALTSKFDNVQFITATPVPVEFTPEIFKKYNYVEYQWEGAKLVNIVATEQASPIGAVCKFVKSLRINGEITIPNENNEQVLVDEFIFFINSVRDIATIIKTEQLTPEECKLVVANKYHNNDILSRAFGINSKELKIARASDPNKKFTFVTSKAFEGVDFYSESALSIVVSTASSKSTLLDMGVSLTQVAGRVRTPENKLKNTLVFIYNTTSFGKSQEEKEEEVETKIDDVKEIIEIYNSLETKGKKRVLRTRLNDDIKHGFLRSEETEGEVEINLDLDAIKLKRYQNYIVGTYSTSLKVHSTIRKKNKAEPDENDYGSDVVIYYMSKQPFREITKKYIDAKEALEASGNKTSESEVLFKERVVMLEKEYPLLHEAYRKLGVKKMQTASNRTEKSLKASVNEFDSLDSMRGKLNDKFEVDNFYSNADINRLLKPEFDRKKIIRNVKATDITFFFEVKQMRRKNQSTGKMEKGYMVEKSIRSYNNSLLNILGIKVA